MRYTDAIADLLTRVRNGIHANHKYVDVPWSKLKEAVVQALLEEGYFVSYNVKKEGTIGLMRVYLKYSNKKSVIRGLKRVSKPGCRVYVKSDELGRYFRKMATPLLTTSRGVITGKQAEKQKIGGEILCTVW